MVKHFLLSSITHRAIETYMIYMVTYPYVHVTLVPKNVHHFRLLRMVNLRIFATILEVGLSLRNENGR